MKKMMAKYNWYKDGQARDMTVAGKEPHEERTSQKFDKEKKTPTTTVMFVPTTKGGLLTKKLKEQKMSMPMFLYVINQNLIQKQKLTKVIRRILLISFKKKKNSMTP